MIFADVEHCSGSITVAAVKCGKKLIREKRVYFSFQVCPGWVYDNLTHARVTQKEGASVEKMPPYDPAVGYFLN